MPKGDKVFDVYGEMSLDTKKVDAGLKKVGNTAKTAGKKVGTSFSQGTSKMDGFRNSLRSSEGGLGRFTDRMGIAAGATGGLSSALGPLGEGLLAGGVLGIGLSAAAAGLAFFVQQSEEARQKIEEIVTKLVEFKSVAEDLKVTINLENVDEMITINQQLINDYEEQKRIQDELISQRDVIVLRKEGEFQAQKELTDEEEKQLALATDYIDKNKDIIPIYEARLEKLENFKTAEENILRVGENLLQARAEELGITVEQLRMRELIGKLTDEQKDKLDDLNIKLAAQLVIAGDLSLTDEQRAIALAQTITLQKSINSLVGIQTDKDKESKSTIDGILKRRKDLNKKIEDINTALLTQKLTEEEINDLLLERFTTRQKLAAMVPPKPPPIKIEGELDIEGMFDALDDVSLPEPIDFDDTIAQMETMSNVTMNIASGFDILGDKTASFGSKISAVISIISGMSAVIQTIQAIGAAAQTATVVTSQVTGAAIAQAYATAAALASTATFGGAAVAGGAALATTVALAQGLAVPRFARGGEAIVPSGFAADSGFIRVSSGEGVKVRTAGQMGVDTKLLANIGTKLDILNKTFIDKDTSPRINLGLEGKKLTKVVTSEQNRLIKAGVDLTQL